MEGKNAAAMPDLNNRKQEAAGPDGWLRARGGQALGASIYDVRKIFEIFDLILPPFPHLGLIYRAPL